MAEQNKEDLNRRMEEIKRKNELLMRRRVEVLADQRQAEESGSSITNILKTQKVSGPRHESSDSDVEDQAASHPPPPNIHERAWDRGKKMPNDLGFDEPNEPYQHEGWNSWKVYNRGKWRGRANFSRQIHHDTNKTGMEQRKQHTAKTYPREDYSQEWKSKPEEDGRTQSWHSRNRRPYLRGRGKYDNERHYNSTDVKRPFSKPSGSRGRIGGTWRRNFRGQSAGHSEWHPVQERGTNVWKSNEAKLDQPNTWSDLSDSEITRVPDLKMEKFLSDVQKYSNMGTAVCGNTNRDQGIAVVCEAESSKLDDKYFHHRKQENENISQSEIESEYKNDLKFVSSQDEMQKGRLTDTNNSTYGTNVGKIESAAVYENCTKTKPDSELSSFVLEKKQDEIDPSHQSIIQSINPPEVCISGNVECTSVCENTTKFQSDYEPESPAFHKNSDEIDTTGENIAHSIESSAKCASEMVKCTSSENPAKLESDYMQESSVSDKSFDSLQQSITPEIVSKNFHEENNDEKTEPSTCVSATKDKNDCELTSCEYGSEISNTPNTKVETTCSSFENFESSFHTGTSVDHPSDDEEMRKQNVCTDIILSQEGYSHDKNEYVSAQDKCETQCTEASEKEVADVEKCDDALKAIETCDSSNETGLPQFESDVQKAAGEEPQRSTSFLKDDHCVSGPEPSDASKTTEAQSAWDVPETVISANVHGIELLWKQPKNFDFDLKNNHTVDGPKTVVFANIHESSASSSDTEGNPGKTAFSRPEEYYDDLVYLLDKKK